MSAGCTARAAGRDTPARARGEAENPTFPAIVAALWRLVSQSPRPVVEDVQIPVGVRLPPVARQIGTQEGGSERNDDVALIDGLVLHGRVDPTVDGNSGCPRH